MRIAAWFRRTENEWAKLPEEIRGAFHGELWSLVETDFKYAGYLDRQTEQISRMQKMEDKVIPDWMDYLNISGLKREAQHKLSQIRPATIGQASRIQGVTPADLALVSIWVERGRQREAASQIGEGAGDTEN
jgi:tRNA uridine 5-carboxymethylaminomethyl modification enzyme